MENTFQLSEVQNDMFTNIGVTFAVAELDAKAALEDFARGVTKEVMVINHETGIEEKHIVADYFTWEAGIAVVKQAYAKKKGVTLDSDTIKSMVKRFYAGLEENFGITKPAKPTEAGQKKAAQRSKAQAAMEELKAKSYDELQAEVAMLAAKPTKANLATASKLISAIEAKKKEDNKDRMAAIKEKQSEIGKLAKKCMEEDILEEVLEILAANIIAQ